MKLSNFETLIEKTIINRGYSYFIENRIDLLYYDEERQEWIATIFGTDEYEVHVCLSESNEILESYCDCPYDWGEFCKHQVAVFYALDDLNSTSNNSFEQSISTAEFEKLLHSISKEDLIQLLLTLATKDKNLKKQICSQFSFNATPVQKAKNLISSIYFEEYDYYDTSYETFTGPVLEALEICSTLDNPNTKLALYCQLVEEIAIYIDEDDHYNSVYLAIEDTFTELTQFIETLPEDSQLRTRCFDTLFSLLKHFPHEECDFIFMFIDLCIQTSNTVDSQKTLHSYLKKLQQSNNNSIAEEAPKLIYAFLEKYNSTQEALAFAETHVENNFFRELLIKKSIRENQLDKALHLCIEGEHSDANSPDLVLRWQYLEYEIYVNQKNSRKQRELAENFVLENDFSYYSVLKQLTPATEWPTVMERILNLLHKDTASHYETIYPKILIHEHLTDKLLAYCQELPKRILTYTTYLEKKYPLEVEKIFVLFICEQASEASNRQAYRNIAPYIQQLRKSCGSKAALALRQDLMNRYTNRPAFRDELSKIAL